MLGKKKKVVVNIEIVPQIYKYVKILQIFFTLINQQTSVQKPLKNHLEVIF